MKSLSPLLPQVQEPKFVEDEYECACGICRSAHEDAFYEKDLILRNIRGKLAWLADFQERWQ